MQKRKVKLEKMQEQITGAGPPAVNDSKTKIMPVNDSNVYGNNNLIHAIKTVERQHFMSQ